MTGFPIKAAIHNPQAVAIDLMNYLTPCFSLEASQFKYVFEICINDQHQWD